MNDEARRRRDPTSVPTVRRVVAKTAVTKRTIEPLPHAVHEEIEADLHNDDRYEVTQRK